MTSLSYRTLPPLEDGGEISRGGMEFQDQVVAGFCLDMIGGQDLLEVWCETLDDATLVWNTPSGEDFEFVQVKSNDLGQFWSLSKLCERKRTTVANRKVAAPGTSILERSLSNNRLGPCRFRIVTAVRVAPDLRVLTRPFAAPDRQTGAQPIIDLAQAARNAVAGFASAAGNDAGYWVERTLWEVRHSDEAVRHANLRQLEKLCEQHGFLLACDHRDDLYGRLLTKVYNASKARYAVDPLAKRLVRAELLAWFLDAARLLHGGAAVKGERLADKLRAGGLPSYEADAQSLRRSYRTRQLSSSYLEIGDREMLEAEAQRVLTGLKLRLDMDDLSPGPTYLQKCMDALDEVARDTPIPASGMKSYLQGLMYDAADRCVFRFAKAAS